ncbi:hypothetical protein GGTG_12919 [Gaeumannomyces tritici R3-111a-1]|uniref:Protein prenyltransferase n=1 Tax=Gaeumannomyces tritici (strain R3-111a-1) TaxID=644352 RepID=J3PHE0_GAET3|nr:hypothetical protein GGTG_12919 [Gaeumannomyces tritici R3-111a-1]EJT69300.1 hypothetical protein GGTG_12919 [Gaeumannomyces tritici R3-111a-1]
MSRALDKDVAASLESSDKAEALAAFVAISGALTQQCQTGTGTDDGLVEIELLGRSHPTPAGCHVLQDGNAIAVPKLSLVRAFIVARMRAIAWQQQQHTATNDADILAVTAVQLLMDPEHLTAANTRKRALVRRAATNGSGALADAVRAEFRLVDSLLTSRLHRHTKSPTLWSHRRWLVQRCTEWSVAAADVHDALQHVVMVSAERHPRNYYAWCHARFLVAPLVSRSSNPREGGVDCYNGALEKILDSTKRWAFSHHTDVSGWSFLWFLLWPPAATWVQEGPGTSRAAAVVAEAAELAVSLRWTNQSVWTFLRTAAAVGLLPHGRSVYERLRASLPHDSPGLETLRRAEDWTRDFGACDVAAISVS